MFVILINKRILTIYIYKIKYVYFSISPQFA